MPGLPRKAASIVLAAVVTTIGLVAPGGAPAHAAVPSVPRAIRVMPLGDSITDGVGSTDNSGYRAELWRRLATNGYGVDFVGSVTAGALPDRDNEGHSGWTIAQIAGGVNAWLAQYTPDVILLHIGTNDLYTDASAAGATDRLNALVDQIRSAAPAATLFVAEITPSTSADDDARTVAYNAGVRGIVAAKNSTRVRLVDQYHAITKADLADTVHPNNAGYAKMGAAWYTAVAPVLTRGTRLKTAVDTTRCLDTGSNPGNGSPAQLWTCHGGAGQRWTRQADTLRVHGLCLQVPTGQSGNATQLQYRACDGGPGQRWELRANGTIRNPASGRCIDVPFGNASPGVKLILWDCHSSTNQVWLTD